MTALFHAGFKPRSLSALAPFSLALSPLGLALVFNMSKPLLLLGFLGSVSMALMLNRREKRSGVGLKKLAVFTAAIFLVVLLLSPAPARAALLTEWNIPAGSLNPLGITRDTLSQKLVWFTEIGSDRIGSLDPGGNKFVEYSLAPGSRPWDINFHKSLGVSDFDTVYFTEAGTSKIGVIVLPVGTTPNVQEINLIGVGQPQVGPRGINVSDNVGQEGGAVPGTFIFVWVAEFGGSAIGLIQIPLGGSPTVRQWLLPDAAVRAPGVQDVAYDKQSGVWFTEFSRDKIGLLQPDLPGIQPWDLDLGDTNGVPGPVGRTCFDSPAPAGGCPALIKEWSLPVGSQPYGITIDHLGDIWFAESGRNQIGKLDPVTNIVTEYSVPSSNAQSFDVRVDDQNNIWFTEHQTNKIGKFVPGANIFVEYSRPAGNPFALYWDVDPSISANDRRMWFTDDTGRIGRIDTTQQITTVTSPTIFRATSASTTTTPSTTTASTTFTTSALTTSGTVTQGTSTRQSVTQFSQMTASESSTFLRTSSLVTFASVSTVVSPITATVTVSSVAATTSGILTSTIIQPLATIVDTTSITTTLPTTVTQTLASTTFVTVTVAQPAIPGFPFESILAGIALGVLGLVIIKRRHSTAGK